MNWLGGAAMWKSADSLQLIGLGLNALGTAVIFMFAYPPKRERWSGFFLGLTRFALVLMFCGFMLQFLAAYLAGHGG
jgi:hypothetical protein